MMDRLAFAPHAGCVTSTPASEHVLDWIGFNLSRVKQVYTVYCSLAFSYERVDQEQSLCRIASLYKQLRDIFAVLCSEKL